MTDDASSQYHYTQGKSFMDRSLKAVEDLADIRGHRAFPYFVDLFEGHVRSAWRGYLDKNVSDEEMLRDRVRAQTYWEIVCEMLEVTSEKELLEAQELCYSRLTVDEDLAAEHASALQAAGQDHTVY